MSKDWVCEECGENKATYHLTEIVDGEKREFHLCEACARQRSAQLPPMTTLQDIFDNLLKQAGAKEYGEMADLQCPVCGLTYGEFRSRGRFGCANDYEVFHKGLVGLLEQIQMDARHVGKVPPGADAGLARENELIRLRRELERCTQREEFEQAAQLRDRIAELTGERREHR